MLLKDVNAGYTVNITRHGVPEIWIAEVSNILTMAAGKGRITEGLLNDSLALLAALPVKIDRLTFLECASRVFPLARKRGLTVYNACYLELSLRMDAGLATLIVASSGSASW